MFVAGQEPHTRVERQVFYASRAANPEGWCVFGIERRRISDLPDRFEFVAFDEGRTRPVPSVTSGG